MKNLPMNLTLPLELKNGHLFVELHGKSWIIDTGSPTSFGRPGSLDFAGRRFPLAEVGLSAEVLSSYVGHACDGLLGVDVLNQFDLLVDAPGGRLVVADGALDHPGEQVELDEFMGIPLVKVAIGGQIHPMFFDTGAQISYFQDESLADYPPAGRVNDFYPGIGQFMVDTHHVPMAIGQIALTAACGRLPGLLAMSLSLAGADAVLGNVLLANRPIGYFPRRKLLVI